VLKRKRTINQSQLKKGEKIRILNIVYWIIADVETVEEWNPLETVGSNNERFIFNKWSH
jgi:hypothetical protein